MATASQVMPHHSPKRRAAIPQAVTTGLGSGSLFGQVFQDPYFNILKQLKLAQQEPKIEGDVQLIIDRSIGSPVYDLSGFIPAATYIQIPGNSSQSLGLTGSILYIELRRIEAEQHFTIHLDVQTLAANLIVRISFSNLFKERKCSGRVIQIPLTKLTPLKWTVFGIDLKSLISSNSSYEFASLKTIKICSTLQLRGLFTSSNIFTPMTLPREMRLPTVTSEQWIEVYDWLWSPKLPELKKEVTHSADGGNRITEKLPNQSKVRHNGTKSGSSRDPTGDLGAKKDPMLELVRVIGYSGEMPQCLIWLHHNTLVYASMDLIIAHDVEFDQQTILAGHTKDVCVLTMCPFARLLVSGQSGKLPFLIIWDVRTLSAICRVPVFSHGLTDVTISYDARLLACSGHDGQGRVQIVVYDLSQVLETGNVSVVARQTSEFKISRIVFSPHPGSQHQLASCGHESIRFWRIKNGHLPGHSCVLNQHARTTFSALCFEPIYGLLSAAASRPRSLYVATTAGSVFIVDFDSFVIRRVLTLHQDSICTIAVTQGFCAAGSSSGLLQIWPLDFANPIAEIRHHQAVTSLCFSEDGLSIAVGNADGNVGILDIHGGGIRNLVASHSSQILAVCVSPCRNEIGTSSSDRSVRIWNSERFQQVHNIKMEDEDALCLTYHPEQSQLALGFKSGKIRIVDISSGSQIIECHVHSGPVRTIFFTRDGRRLFTASDDRHVYAFDVLRQYQPVRVLAASFTADVSLSCSPIAPIHAWSNG
uniref:Uncharacterized protein n=1 Tax=Spongospora subterranea TaxID=70186 RepID=A0A0H5QYI0_9EUKA|eukprot:CRZ06980.1 hypothetical protein [Spongospora subterranea]